MNNRLSSLSLRLPWLLLAIATAAAPQDRNLQAQAADPSSSHPRVALVIGNSSYKESPLRNPINDARAIAARLRALGFDVIERENAGRQEMEGALREFGHRLARAEAGVFYYAGHGMQIKGRNYLIPVDAQIESEDEVAYRSVEAAAVLDKMDAARSRTNIVILDACRNNPFRRLFRSRSAGLAEMEAPIGTLIAFATAPGSVAADGEGLNGLYTKHLLRQMEEPAPVEQVFKRVRVAVSRETHDHQIPWESSSLKEDFFFRPPAQAPSAAPGLPGVSEAALELAFWDAIKNSTRAADYRAYLEQYPTGRFAALARVRAQAFAETVPFPATAAATPTPSPAASPPASPAASPPASIAAARPEPPSSAVPALAGGASPILTAGSDVTAVAFSSDSRWIATASGDGELRLFGASNGFLLKHFSLRASARPTAIAIAPDGSSLAIGTAGGEVALLALSNGRELQPRQVAHGEAVAFLAFAPNGRYVLSATRGGEVLLRSLRTGETMQRFQFAEAPLVDLQYSPDGRYFSIVQALARAPRVRVFDVANGQTIYTAEASAASFSVNGSWLLLASRRSPVLVDLATKRELRRYTALASDIVRGAYADNGSRVSTYDAAGFAMLWETQNGNKVAEMRVGAPAQRAIAFSPDAKVLALVDPSGHLAIHRFEEQRP